jgi:hypothetical protein
LRVDPLRYFEELALVMEAEQRDAIEWSRGRAKQLGLLGTKQEIRPRSTWFIPVSIVIGILAVAGILGAAITSTAPLRGGSHIGLPLGIGAASCVLGAALLGVRKRMRDHGIGKLEAWTQFHMLLGAVGFTAAVAHAGFRVTGVFTTLLLLVFALEVASGVWGQWIYMTVPKALTRLERHGLARLVEDLLDEETTLEGSVRELIATLPAKLRRSASNRIETIAGTPGARLRRDYDPPAALANAKTQLADVIARTDQLTDEIRGTLERVLESRCRLVDVRAQLDLHRRLRTWVVLHVATASALLILLAFHVVTAMTLL